MLILLPKPLITYIASFLKPLHYLALRTVCKKLYDALSISHFRLLIRNEPLFCATRKREKMAYVHYIGDNYREHLAGCSISKLRLQTNIINDFDPTTHFDFLDLSENSGNADVWRIEGCKTIKINRFIPVESSAKIYLNMHYYKTICTGPRDYIINWCIPKATRRNLIIQKNHSHPEKRGPFRKLKIYDTSISDKIDLIRTFSKVELHYTSFFRHLSIFQNITYLKLFGVIPPYDLPPQLIKLKMINIFALDHLDSSSKKNYIRNLEHLRFLKIKNCAEKLYFMNLPEHLHVFKAVVVAPDTFLISRIFEIKTNARIVLKRNVNQSPF